MLEALDGATSGIVGGIGADLAGAVGSGTFQVDLAALRQHYYDVLDVRSRLVASMQGLQDSAAASAGEHTSQFSEVSASFEQTWKSVGSGGNATMGGGLDAVLARISKYADDIADVYKSYVTVDTDGTDTLTSSAAAQVGH